MARSKVSVLQEHFAQPAIQSRYSVDLSGLLRAAPACTLVSSFDQRNWLSPSISQRFTFGSQRILALCGGYSALVPRRRSVAFPIRSDFSTEIRAISYRPRFRSKPVPTLTQGPRDYGKRASLMKWPTLKCPFCGGILPNREARPGKPLTCPVCSRQLQPSRWQMRLSGVIALILTIALCRFLGVHGFWLPAAIIALWFPICVIWDFVFVRIVSPKFEAYGRKDSSSHSRL